MKSYARGNLGKDENIIHESKISIIPLISYIIPVIIFAIAMFIVQNIWFAIISVAIIFLCIVDLIKAIIGILTTELVVTNKRVIGKTGLINTKTLEAPLDKITTVSIKKGLLGHIFNYGTVNINVFSDKYDYNFIEKPELLKNELMKLV